ncbi:unnamed protein product [Cuscuta campestris]|uniref:Uncharacterized protein n=1 Tax=Cuscuta campestris TaxID=132261 RepID=A0A484LNH5_9ASTE|nr:unnamed protein product [Cuscuta campestris]
MSSSPFVSLPIDTTYFSESSPLSSLKHFIGSTIFTALLSVVFTALISDAGGPPLRFACMWCYDPCIGNMQHVCGVTILAFAEYLLAGSPLLPDCTYDYVDDFRRQYAARIFRMTVA